MNKTTLADIYLPTRDFSLLVAPRDSQHELLLLQIGRDLERGKFLDLQASGPISTVIADTDSEDPTEINGVLDSLDFSPPVWSMPESKKSERPENLMAALIKGVDPLWPTTVANRLLLITEIYPFYPDKHSSHRDVAHICRQIRAAAVSMNCAILASMAVAKSPIRQELRPRDRVYGSSAWSDMANNVWVLEDSRSRARTLHISKKTAAPRTYSLVANAEFEYSLQPQSESISTKLYRLLDRIPDASAMQRQDVMDILDPDFAVSPESWKLWFRHAVSSGRLKRVSKGIYWKPPSFASAKAEVAATVN